MLEGDVCAVIGGCLGICWRYLGGFFGSFYGVTVSENYVWKHTSISTQLKNCPDFWLDFWPAFGGGKEPCVQCTVRIGLKENPSNTSQIVPEKSKTLKPPKPFKLLLPSYWPGFWPWFWPGFRRGKQPWIQCTVRPGLTKATHKPKTIHSKTLTLPKPLNLLNGL